MLYFSIITLYMCPSQTEGTLENPMYECLMSYSLLVTNLNAAQISLHPKWPQILVIASSSCFESEPNSCKPPVNCVILQWKHQSYLNLDRRDFFSCFNPNSQIATFRSFWSVYDKDPFLTIKQLSPRLELTGTAHLRLGSTTNQVLS